MWLVRFSSESPPLDYFHYPADPNRGYAPPKWLRFQISGCTPFWIQCPGSNWNYPRFLHRSVLPTDLRDSNLHLPESAENSKILGMALIQTLGRTYIARGKWALLGQNLFASTKHLRCGQRKNWEQNRAKQPIALYWTWWDWASRDFDRLNKTSLRVSMVRETGRIQFSRQSIVIDIRNCQALHDIRLLILW